MPNSREPGGADLYQRPVQLTCAQLLVVIEVTVLGSLAKRFQAVQQASTLASQLSKTLIASQLARRYCQFSTGFRACPRAEPAPAKAGVIRGPGRRAARSAGRDCRAGRGRVRSTRCHLVPQWPQGRSIFFDR